MGPAEQLAGLDLGNGWKVTERVCRKKNATGGNFSVGYWAVHSSGTRGFLKALDYTWAFQHPDTVAVLQAMTQAYLFEKQLCEKCGHLSKVVRALHSDAIHLDPNDPTKKVEYLIFERADEDIRSHLDAQQTLDVVFLLRTLHQVATGLKQLHQTDIAHQDLKPSNVLICDGGDTSKICDLGRAWDKHSSASHDSLSVAGDPGYAPVEGMYQFTSGDYRARRFGCDLYHLGSLAIFLFARTHATTVVVDNLAPEHRSGLWGGTYQEVLPYVQVAWELGRKQIEPHFPEAIRDAMCTAITELCEPDIDKRGHPHSRGTNQFSLERYLSLFDLLTYRTQISLRSVKARAKC